MSLHNPNIASERLVNGTTLLLGDSQLTVDYHQDAKLEGCLERLKKSRLELMGVSAKDVIWNLRSLVLKLLPGDPSAQSSTKMLLSQAQEPVLVDAARNVALKYLADRIGFASSLGPSLELELINPSNSRTYSVPTAFWSMNGEQVADWTSQIGLGEIFGSLDAYRVDLVSFTLGERIYRGNVASIHRCNLRSEARVAKIFMVDQMEPIKVRNCLREFYLMQELCTNPALQNGLIRYYGHHFDATPPRQLVMFMEGADGALSSEFVASGRVNAPSQAQNVGQAGAFDPSTSATPTSSDDTAPKTLPLRRFVHAALSILKALVFLHQSHVMHRDLKCANILMINDPTEPFETRIVLADFGLSKKLCSQKNFTHSSLGSTRWMAPETLSGSASSYSSDIWSFGMTLVELLTGKLPYHGTLVLDVPKMVGEKKLPKIDWRHTGSDWDPIKNMIADCLNFEPDLRPTAHTLLQRLTDLYPLHYMTARRNHTWAPL